MKGFKDNFDAYSLLTIAIIVLLFDIANLLFGIKGFDINSVILFLLSLLCIAFVIERLKKIDKIDNKLDSIEKAVSGVAGLKIIYDPQEVDKKSEEVVQKTQRYIRSASLSYGTPEGTNINITNRFAEIAIAVLKKSKQREKPIEYKNVVRKERNVQPKYEKFREHDVGTQIRIRKIESFANFNLLIIDKNYLILAFPESSIDERFRTCIFVEHDEKFIGGMIEWFENHIWENAIDFQAKTPTK